MMQEKINKTNILNKIITFLKESRLEMKKVNWPTKQETLNYTLIILGVVVGVALFLGAIDFLFNMFLTKVLIK